MFLFEDRRLGRHNYVFTILDPRKDEFRGNVIDGVGLEYDLEAISSWTDGTPRPDPKLGRDPKNPKHYRVFMYPDELRQACFELIADDTPIVAASYSSYRRMFPDPPEFAERIEEPEWHAYLDQIDEATRIRRQRNVAAEPPPGSDSVRIAEWVAQRHMSVDGSIRQVWYLPTGAPAGEIRLLEVNDRLAPPNGGTVPVDFDVEIAGTPLKLLVADVTSEELERMRQDPAALPDGWKMDGARSWGLPA